MKIKSRALYLGIACLSFWGCEKEGPAGKNALIDQIAEPPGEHCASGGIKVITGIDDNRNNVLDSNEIQKTEYVCNGIYNKETILYATPDGIGSWTNSATGSIRPGVDNFNITNYPADSISFTAQLVTADANVKCMIELYDLTNNKVINHTLLSGNSTTNEYKATTVNFINELPKSYINLGFRIRSEKDGTSVTVSRLAIKLYKK